MTYPESSSTTPALTDERTLEVAMACLLEHMPISTEGGYSPEDFFHVMLRAASRGDSLEHTAKRLEGAPSGNTIRYHLDKWTDMASLEERLNLALKSRLPAKLKKRGLKLAIDLHLIPYYGTPNEAELPYIYRSQAQSGTTRFFAYASLYVICCNKRVTLAIHAVDSQETLVATITRLLSRLTPLKIRVKCLYLDRGFYNVPVIRWLKALNIPFLMPAIIRGKNGGTRALLKGRKSYACHYTMRSQTYGAVTFQMRVVCNYHKGKRGKHGVQYSLYVVHRVTVALHQLHHHYKDRFGIETSYRLKNHCRIRTTSKNPVTRFLFVALAFLLVNLWVYLLWCCVSRRERGRQIVYREFLSLKTMLELLSSAVERRFPVITSIYFPALE